MGTFSPGANQGLIVISAKAQATVAMLRGPWCAFLSPFAHCLLLCQMQERAALVCDGVLESRIL
eukprot:scaffold229522_cov15-Tisochrysis_lutea.AAC.1